MTFGHRPDGWPSSSSPITKRPTSPRPCRALPGGRTRCSSSTRSDYDATVAIAARYGCHVASHKFEDYATQRNFALDHLPISTEWILFLDADEWVPAPLRDEITQLIARAPAEDGFYVRFRFIWMSRWIRRGYYPCWILRLFRHGKGRSENRAINEQIVVEGRAGYLSNDLIHEDRRGVGDWIAKHNRYATGEALELARTERERASKELDARLFGAQVERKRWIRRRVWNRLPPLFRPFAYFFYRYVLRFGFLDGVAGFTFHFLQALWYPLLIDIKHLEFRESGHGTSSAAAATRQVESPALAGSAGHEQAR